MDVPALVERAKKGKMYTNVMTLKLAQLSYGAGVLEADTVIPRIPDRTTTPHSRSHPSSFEL
jgi:hypothetical protein